MIPLLTTLPENSNDGYVAAAYIVFFALVLVYVAIMAIRLSRVERKVEELRGNTDTGGLAREGSVNGAPEDPHPEGTRQERTLTGTPHGGGQAGETV
jgi:hypothetical protein